LNFLNRAGNGEMERQNRPLIDLPKIAIGFGLLAIHPPF
jgi:hypothetical protein